MLATPASPAVAAVTQTASAVPSRLALRSRPGGPVVAVLGRRTEFGSPVVLGVAVRRGSWDAVITSALPNGRLGWVPAAQLRLAPMRYAIVVDLASRRLLVERGGRVLRTVEVGVGGADSPTPTGEFTVTDKLAGNAVYGCCILALSGHQPHPPPGWTGGTRLAIHGGAVGGATSSGCVHADDADLRWLMATVPLGTPVTIRS
jgi:lipoprotein-anchoring transpeptidase ErfK/SrfK